MYHGELTEGAIQPTVFTEICSNRPPLGTREELAP
jgi:hypothetical protein